MERALPWVCSHPNTRPPPLLFPVEEYEPLQNNCVNETESTCQMTRFIFISLMKCVPASCHDDWNQPSVSSEVNYLACFLAQTGVYSNHS